MEKIKIIREIKPKVNEVQKGSDLEREVDSSSFPKEDSSSPDSSSSNKAFVPILAQSEVPQVQEEIERPKDTSQNAPQFSESARYDTSMPRFDRGENRITYQSQNAQVERLDPTLVKNETTLRSGGGVNFRTDELDRIHGHEKNYDEPLDMIKDVKIKNLRPWEL